MFVIIDYNVNDKNYEIEVFDTRNLKGKDILFDWIAI